MLRNEDKVIALYNYIGAISKLQKKTKKKIEEEKWYMQLENIPKDEKIIINYTEDDGLLIEIQKKDFLKPLEISQNLLKWIDGSWSNYKSKISIKKSIVIDSENEEENSKIEMISSEIEKELEIKIKERDLWTIEQKKIEITHNFFNDIYMQYLDLKKDSESLELYLGNGIILVRNNQFFSKEIKQNNLENRIKVNKDEIKVYFPILLRKMNIEFIAEKNILQIKEIEDNSIETELYTDFLNQVEGINLESIFNLEEKLKKINLHPLDKKATDTFFREFIHSLSVNGYVYEEDKKYRDEDILIYDKPVFIIKKKELDFVKNINNIVSEIQNGKEIPKHLLELIGVSSQVEEDSDPRTQYSKNILSDKDILFTKESNKEQLEIAKRIEKYNAVVVQGPPGTGKTHTIANLLGHFLAQGKNILVTSQTQKALKVLKEKIPKNIRGLCVSVLDSNRTDMRQSVESISEKLGFYSSDKLQEEIKNCEFIREKILKDLEEKNKKIVDIKNQEKKNIIYNGENFSIREAATYVKSNEKLLDKIPGKIEKDRTCPVDNKDIDFLQNKYLEEITEEEEKEVVLGLQDINLFLESDKYEELILKKEEYFNEFKNIKKEREYFIKSGFLYLKDKKIIDLEKIKGYSEEENPLISLINIKKWEVEAALSGMEGNIGKRKKWEIFLEDIRILYAKFEKKEEKFFKVKIDINIPDMKLAKKIVEELKEAIQNPGFLFKSRLKTAKEKISSNVLINKKIIETVDECNLILENIDFFIKEEEVKQSWDLLIGKNDGIYSQEIEDFSIFAYQFINRIEYFLNWEAKEKEKILCYLKDKGVFFENILETSDTPIQKLKNFMLSSEEIILNMKVGVSAFLLNEKNSEIQNYRMKLNSILREDSNWDKKLKESIEKQDVKQYRSSLYELEKLIEKQNLVEKRKKLLEIIQEVAPDLGTTLKKEKIFENSDDIYEIWKLKQLSQILEEIASQPYETLQKEIFETEKKLKEITTELAEKKAWYHVISFVEKPENLQVNQALRGWGQSIQKIGKGTGKNVNLYRKQAKEKMVICQKAVPIWIMPMSIVLDTLNPITNKFDIVIIDEASQSDLTSLILLYMAKKIIIVGDDRQVSPLSIGVTIDEVNLLRERYIKNRIFNDDLYGLNSSLYSIATTTYQPLMLKEHFRCVPDIIGYSNKTSYDYKIKPLREANSSKLRPAIVNFRVDGKRDENTKKNIVEAETIVSLIQACIEEKEYQNLTFGVISLLGDEQADYIQKLILEKIGEAEIEKHQILCGNPSHFQGDEKDVIFLSMVDSNELEVGAMRILGEGTEGSNKKRYNVAVSRAKDQLWIVHSLDFENDLKVGDLRKELLEYSLEPKKFIEEDILEKKSESIFEKEVARYLLERGYNVTQQWEVGSYRIDMVISFGENRIALECDGEAWHSSEEQIQNDINRQEILERCGWKFIRIRGSRYFRNPEKTMESVVLELNENKIYPEKNKVDKAKESSNELLNKLKNRAFEIRTSWNEKREIENNVSRNEEIQKNTKVTLNIDMKLIGEEGKQKEEVEKNISKNEKNIKKKEMSEIIISENDDLIDILNKNNLDYIDNREISKILWIIFNPDKKEFIENLLEKREYRYGLEKRGSIATQGRKAWRVMIGEEICEG